MHKDEHKSYLYPYKLENNWASQYRKDAPDDSVSKLIEFKVDDEFDVAKIAFEFVREVYLWFGFEEDKIPYVTEENQIKRINTEELKKL